MSYAGRRGEGPPYIRPVIVPAPSSSSSWHSPSPSHSHSHPGSFPPPSSLSANGGAGSAGSASSSTSTSAAAAALVPRPHVLDQYRLPSLAATFSAASAAAAAAASGTGSSSHHSSPSSLRSPCCIGLDCRPSASASAAAASSPGRAPLPSLAQSCSSRSGSMSTSTAGNQPTTPSWAVTPSSSTSTSRNNARGQGSGGGQKPESSIEREDPVSGRIDAAEETDDERTGVGSGSGDDPSRKGERRGSEFKREGSLRFSSKKKRARVVLSCTMCVRRKTKCDKVVPCSACVRRGSPNDCVVEGVDEVAPADWSPNRSLPSQPFALNEELVALRSRVNTLEGLVNSLLTASRTSPATQPISSPSYISASTPTSHLLPHKAENDEAHVAEALQRLSEGVTNDVRSPNGIAARLNASSNHFRSSGSPELDHILSLIPERAICDLLLESYLLRVDWQLHILHIPTLKHDYRTMWDKLRSPAPAMGPESLEAWVPPRLGTFFMVLALGMYFVPPELSPYSAVEAAAMPSKWLDAAEKALGLADWSGRPQLRTVQTILLMGQFWHHLGEIDRFVIWIGAGVRVAQSLGLHNAEQTGILHLPYDDFPIKTYARDFFCREMGKRSWWSLCADDWDVSYRTRNVSVLRTQDFSTPSPFNLTDDDLMDGPVPSRNLTQPTSVTFQICFSDLIYLSQQWRQPHREMGNIGNLSVETVISLDEIVRGMSVRFPFYLQLEKKDDPAVKALEQAHPLVAIQRLHLAKELHCRYVRLHRRALFGDDLGTAQARVSRATLRSSASTLLSIVAEFRAKTDYAHKLWWVNSYMTLAAVALLFSNIQLLISSPTPVASSVLNDAASKRHEVLTTLTLTRGTPPLSPHTVQGLRIIDLLLQEENVIIANAKRATVGGRQLSERDAERYYAAMDVVAKATMCVAERETLRLKDLADHWNDFEPRPQSVLQQQQQIAAQGGQQQQVGQLIPPSGMQQQHHQLQQQQQQQQATVTATQNATSHMGVEGGAPMLVVPSPNGGGGGANYATRSNNGGSMSGMQTPNNGAMSQQHHQQAANYHLSSSPTSLDFSHPQAWGTTAASGAPQGYANTSAGVAVASTGSSAGAGGLGGLQAFQFPYDPFWTQDDGWDDISRLV
ncbi:BZ3500_MvSof-1268-A1-R1_Chr12-2g03708 [Microbotryum saponariae]|uniref:BZ3500_MvSof-1268-A1-R1_Chr12-2g03708 protein n=1 Tax=Microbotryum saponariae TaxID=289078 RepID=A0A2X0KKB5_9BASI|nr:BZ3500_MvSof-1268-A1-R1_Chr12-2g03708 [Microbotryum saponariae]SDA05296.1 BZ3501_MvSof-1269-A2-R1_Chr12-1g03280 [Microbotryum saponariae]